MLEDKLHKIWAWASYGRNDNTFDYVGDEVVAREEYKILLEKVKTHQNYAEIKCTARAIKAHLFEAFTSPSCYVREWAKLLKE